MAFAAAAAAAAARPAASSFVLPPGYTGIKVVGSGAYGVVVAATAPSGRRVAVKRVPRWTSDVIDGKRVLREAKLLRFLAGHENVVELLALEAADACEDVFIVTSLFETDLHKVIYSKQSLSEAHTRWFVYQTLRGLKFLHSAGVLHRDLKPSNLLVNSDCACGAGRRRGEV